MLNGVDFGPFKHSCFDKGLKAYATMSIGIMGRKIEFGVDWLWFTVFTNKKRESINTFVCTVSLYGVAKTPNASIKDHEPHYPWYLSVLSPTVLLDNLSRNSCIQPNYFALLNFGPFYYTEEMFRSDLMAKLLVPSILYRGNISQLHVFSGQGYGRLYYAE